MNTDRKGFVSWFLQRITALLLVIGLGVHFYVFHFSPDRYVSRYYDKIVERFCSPGWIAFHVCLLALVIYHGLNGVWCIINDYNIGNKCADFLKQALWFVGLLLFGTGVYILVWFADKEVGGFMV